MRVPSPTRARTSASSRSTATPDVAFLEQVARRRLRPRAARLGHRRRGLGALIARTEVAARPPGLPDGRCSDSPSPCHTLYSASIAAQDPSFEAPQTSPASGPGSRAGRAGAVGSRRWLRSSHPCASPTSSRSRSRTGCRGCRCGARSASRRSGSTPTSPRSRRARRRGAHRAEPRPRRGVRRPHRTRHVHAGRRDARRARRHRRLRPRAGGPPRRRRRRTGDLRARDRRQGRESRTPPRPGSGISRPSDTASDADYDGALKLLAEGLERFPDNAGMLYSVACWESLAGRTDAALGHLRRALELDPGFATWAQTDTDLDSDPCPAPDSPARSAGPSRPVRGRTSCSASARQAGQVREPKLAAAGLPGGRSASRRSVWRSAPSAWRSARRWPWGPRRPRSRMQAASRSARSWSDDRTRSGSSPHCFAARSSRSVPSPADEPRRATRCHRARACTRRTSRTFCCHGRPHASSAACAVSTVGRLACEFDPVLRHAAAPRGALRLLGGSSGDGDAGRDRGQGDDDGDEDQRAARHSGAHGFVLSGSVGPGSPRPAPCRMPGRTFGRR